MSTFFHVFQCNTTSDGHKCSNGEFEMTTDSSNNSYVNDGKLYIVPTLTSDVIGYNNVLNGYTYNISGCTSTNGISLVYVLH